MSELLVVPAIGSRHVAGGQWPGIRYGEDALQMLDFSNDLLSVHDFPHLITKHEATELSFIAL